MSIYLFQPGQVQQNVLYISSQDGKSEKSFSNTKYAFAMLNLTDLEILYENKMFGQKSSVLILEDTSKTYHIKYIYGFQSEGFSYMLTEQTKSVGDSSFSSYTSKILRVCQNDFKFLSYAEVELICKSG